MNNMNEYLSQIAAEVKTIDDKKKKLEVQARLEEAMRNYAGEDKLISSLEILERIKLQPEETKFMTGLEGVDNILGGFRENQLIVLAAPTKSGKTQFCIELTIRMESTNPVWIPFEESAEELIRKFHDRGVPPPLFYTPQSITGNTVAWVEKRIIEGMVKFGSKLFFIDHLHFIVPFSSDRLDTRIGQTMRDLKSIAKRNNVAIVIISHLKKTNIEITPTLEDLRDSSFIAQEADTVMMLWREAKRTGNEIEVTNNAILSIQANRRTGKTGNVKLVFENGRYLEMDWKHGDDVQELKKVTEAWKG